MFWQSVSTAGCYSQQKRTLIHWGATVLCRPIWQVEKQLCLECDYRESFTIFIVKSYALTKLTD